MLPKLFTPIDDDAEEAPWMMMGTPQFRAADRIFNALEAEMERRGESLLVAAMLPILFMPGPGDTVRTLSPDIMVARVPAGDRQSYDVAREGGPPDFVLEVISPESRLRDLNLKPGWYELMGVQEYAIFEPATRTRGRRARPQLHGYRRDSVTRAFTQWEADADGRLYSGVLGLWLVAREDELRAQRLDGEWVPTQRDEREAREEAEARMAQLEAEIARLREELRRRDHD